MAAMLVLALSYGRDGRFPERRPAARSHRRAGRSVGPAVRLSPVGRHEGARGRVPDRHVRGISAARARGEGPRPSCHPGRGGAVGAVAAESPGGLVWVGPGTLVAFGLLTWHRRARSTAPTVAPAVAVDASPQATGAATPAEAAKPAAKPANASRGKREGSQAARVTPPARRASGAPASMASTRRRTGAGGESRWSGGRRREPARWRALLDDARGRVADARGRAADGPGAGAWLAGLSTSSRRLAAAAIIIALGGLVLALAGWLGGHVPRGAYRRRRGGGRRPAPALNPVQVAGIWPNGDFRTRPRRLADLRAIAVAVIGAIAGLVLCVRRRRTAVVPTSRARSPERRSSTCSRRRGSGPRPLPRRRGRPFAALIAAFTLPRPARLARRRPGGRGDRRHPASDALGDHDVWRGPAAPLAE